MLLLLDNHDSFVYNLARYFERLGQPTHIVRSDRIDVATVRKLAPQAIVISPGPSTPENAGCCCDVVRSLYAETPILGICLGHQVIAAALGARVVRGEPRHGRTSAIMHAGRHLFAGVASPLIACRYHSLIVEEATLPPGIEATARTEDHVIMGIRHRQLPLFGLQFHPESILTVDGYRLLANFLGQAGIAAQGDPDVLAATERSATPTEPPCPPHVVTF